MQLLISMFILLEGSLLPILFFQLWHLARVDARRRAHIQFIRDFSSSGDIW